MGRREGKRGASLTALRVLVLPSPIPSHSYSSRKASPKEEACLRSLSTDLMQDYSRIPNMCLKKLILHLRESRFHSSEVSYGLGAFDL